MSFSEETAQSERRRLVAGLYIRRIPKGEIAKLAKCSTQTITRDIKWLKNEWNNELIKDPVAQRGRTLASLQELEKAAAARYLSTKELGWWTRWLDSVQAVSTFLGLDAPIKIEGQVKLVVQGGEIDWDAIPDDLADRFLALNAELVALQPASGGMVVNQDGSPAETDPQDVPF